MKSPIPVFTLSEAEYLENEKASPVRHEYLAGLVYAMAGASAAHNIIAGNLFTRLRMHLRGKPCQAFMSDMKVKIEAIDTFYYPDVMVACDPSDNADYFRTNPVLIIEVTSPTTAATDRREKLLAYQKIHGLREYVLIAQDEVSVQVYRRNKNGRWWEETLGPDDVIELESVDLNMTVKEAYEDVNL
ncbi:MAG TPA: Uma2 family endonuclease [Blastocatellia bacterium]|jgi:Uma2 family endonuclease|nr:Uma2 family endonuclease [Blastocatellia bacterium]